ncbi:hypothetical protein GCM10028805_36810 [Spirosoma harenae]
MMTQTWWIFSHERLNTRFPRPAFVTAAAYFSESTGRGPRFVLMDINLQSDISGLDFLTLLRGHAQGRLLLPLFCQPIRTR